MTHVDLIEKLLKYGGRSPLPYTCPRMQDEAILTMDIIDIPLTAELRRRST